MKPTALVVLSALLLGVAALVYFDRGRPTTDEVKRATEQLFPGLDPARVDKIVIERGGAAITLLRRAGWWLGDGTRADDAAVDPILSTLAYGQVERLVDSAARDGSGVDSPRVRLLATGRDLTIDLRIGADAAGRGVYVARGGDLLVAESRLLEVTDRDAGAFLSRAALLEEPTAVTTLQIGPLAIERHGAGWRVIQPKPALADSERVGALLSALARARAESTQPGPAPSPRPDEVALTLDGRSQARIRWSESTCGKLPQLVRADGVLLCFAADTLQPLQVTVDQLREPHLTDLRLDDVSTIDLEVAGRRLSLRRAQHAWRITAPAEEAAPADDAKVRERLAEILKLRARAFAVPSGDPVGRIRLGGDSGQVSLTLARSNRELTAQRDGEDLALLLPASALKLFDPEPLRCAAAGSTPLSPLK